MAGVVQQPLEELSLCNSDNDAIVIDGDCARCRACNVAFVAKNAKSIKQHLKSKPHKAAVKAGGQSANNIPDGNACTKKERQQQTEQMLLLQLLSEVVGADCCLTSSSGYPLMLCSHGNHDKPRPILAPPFLMRPRPQDLCQGPFLTLQSAAITQVPSSMQEAVELFCHPGAARFPNVDVEGDNCCIKSWSHARKVLAAAESANRCCWASFVAPITHPPWWPRSRHVPTYDNVIVGRGPACIGMHVDVDNFSGTRSPVSTYLSMVEGRKRVMLLPPGQTLFPIDTKEAFPVDPSPDLMARIGAAGGFYFDLMPLKTTKEDLSDTCGGTGSGEGETVTLFLPSGWCHWLLGDSDWHCVISGSVYAGNQ